MIKTGSRPWLAMLLGILLLVSNLAPALAETRTLSDDEAIALLQAYGIVQGDQNGDLNLDNQITRAEAAAVFVRAAGAGSYADLLASTVRFDDAKGHWGAGYIETAARLNLMKGRSETQFDPDAKITNAEALTVVLRLIEREPFGQWNPNLIMNTASGLGILPAGPTELIVNLPALRGYIFRSLARAIATVPMADGKTALQKNVDKTPPQIHFNTPPAHTGAETITVTGTATDAVRVTVNGVTATLSGQRFTAEVPLAVGDNTVKAIAYDLAGNTSTAEHKVTRSGEAARIEVEGPDQVKAGASITITATAYDASGYALSRNAVEAKVVGNIGTYDMATGTFQAGVRAGEGSIVFTSGDISTSYTVKVLGPSAEAAGLRIRTVNNGQPVTVGKSATLEVEVLDKDGAVLSLDNGRTVSLTLAGLSGISVSSSTATTVEGVATFSLSGTNPGRATATVSSTGLTGDIRPVDFATATRVVLTSDPENPIADGTTPVLLRAVLQDEKGNPVTNNTQHDITIRITSNSNTSTLGGTTLVIRRGYSSSAGFDSSLVPGFKSEDVLITGELTSDHTFTVVPQTVSFKELVIGSPSKMRITGGRGSQYPSETNLIPLTVEVTDKDGNVVSGSYAFQVKVTTSNDAFEGKVGGLPAGLNLTVGETGQRPVVDAVDNVVARTTNGRATLLLSYNKSGKVTLELVGVKTSTALNTNGDEGTGNSTTGLDSEPHHVYFGKNPEGAKAVIDLPKLKLSNQGMGLLPADGSSTATIRVYVVDDQGAWIPGEDGTVTLERVSDTATRATKLLGGNQDFAEARVKDGVAEFTIVATKVSGLDEWKATASRAASSPATIEVATVTGKPSQPVIQSVSGDLSGMPDRVTATDTALEIQFDPYSFGTLGLVHVYRSGSRTPIFTSDILDLYETPYVRVPKDELSSSERYAIVVHNGNGESAKSEFWPLDSSQRVIKESALEIDITKVRYDAENEKLSVSTNSGVTSSGTIDSSLLYLSNPANDYKVYLTGSSCSTSSRSFTCDLSGFGITSAEFPDGAILRTEHGWYYRTSSGETALPDDDISDNHVSPLAHITYGAIRFQEEGGTLYLYGANLNEGRIYLSKIVVNGVPLSTSSSKYVTTSNPREIAISLPESVISGIRDAGPVTDLDAELGWLVSGNDRNPSLTDAPVYGMADIKRVQYDAGTDTLILTGTGLETATIDPTMLVITNRNGDELNDVDLSEVGKSPTVTEQTATTIKIKLHTDHATALEASANKYRGNVFLTSEATNGMNTWFITEDYWYDAGLPDRYYRLTW